MRNSGLLLNSVLASFIIMTQIVASYDVLAANQMPTQEQSLSDVRETLEKVYEEDQAVRRQFGPALKTHGRDSDEFASLVARCKEADISNQKIVAEILDEHGWLGTGQIGRRANQALFLVLQHADNDRVMQEKYLPLLQEAVAEGNAEAIHLGMLQDRIAIAKGEPQIYGTQMSKKPDSESYEVAPLLDPETVDERRASIGLGPMSEYIKMWQLDWEEELRRLKQ